MTTALAIASEAATPTDLIGLVRVARRRREQAEREILALAGAWAVSHEVEGPRRQEGTGEFPETPRDPGDPGDPDTTTEAEIEADEARAQWRGLPELTWDAAAPFSAALRMSTRGGASLLRHALTLRHRLPCTQARWEWGKVETRAARQVADAIAGQPDDVCAWVDLQVARRIDAHRVVGPVVLDRLVAEATAELHAEEVELIREEEKRARWARIADGPDACGLAEFIARGDWPDIKAFNDTLAALAEALRRAGGPEAAESLDVRRSIAVGILADPARALALLDPSEPGDTERSARPAARRQQKMMIAFHLAADVVSGRLVAGRDTIAVDTDGTAWLDAALREWAGRDDVALTVRPVIHCGGCPDCETYCDDRHERVTYRPTDLDKERVSLAMPRCVFPFCSMPARRCDCDHITPYDAELGDGPTCPKCNLAPLCRHHHRLKTRAGWRYRQVEPGVFTWTEPHRQSFVTTRWGTTDTTDQDTHPPPVDGTQRQRTGGRTDPSARVRGVGALGWGGASRVARGHARGEGARMGATAPLLALQPGPARTGAEGVQG